MMQSNRQQAYRILLGSSVNVVGIRKSAEAICVLQTWSLKNPHSKLLKTFFYFYDASVFYVIGTGTTLIVTNMFEKAVYNKPISLGVQISGSI